MNNDLTEAEKQRLLIASVELGRRLKEAFGTEDAPWRNRQIFALRSVADFMLAIDCPIEWTHHPFELAQALVDLEYGITPEALKPAGH